MGIVNKILYSKVCWQHPAMICLYTFPAHNLNFHWRWKWWDRIQASFFIYFLLYLPQVWWKTLCGWKRSEPVGLQPQIFKAIEAAKCERMHLLQPTLTEVKMDQLMKATEGLIAHRWDRIWPWLKNILLVGIFWKISNYKRQKKNSSIGWKLWSIL